MENQDYETLLKEGPAEFEIDMIADKDKNGNDYISKAGDKMVKAMLHVVDGNSDVGTIWLNITRKHLYMLRPLFEAVGMHDLYKEYKQGHPVLEELIGQEGRCELVIRRDEQYGDKMDIKRFFAKKSVVEKAAVQCVGPVPAEDGIPF